jgi:hypothetical protein
MVFAMINDFEALFQLPAYQCVILFVISLGCLLGSIEFKQINNSPTAHGIQRLIEFIGTVSFILFLVKVYECLKN